MSTILKRMGMLVALLASGCIGTMDADEQCLESEQVCNINEQEEMATSAQALDTTPEDDGDNAGLSMVQLQSLVSQRGAAVQLATNLTEAVHEGQKDMAGKIGDSDAGAN